MKYKVKKLLAKDNISIDSALKKIKNGGKKGLVIIGENNILKGTLTDGDIRNAIVNGTNIKKSIKDIYQKKPYFLNSSKIRKDSIKKIFLKNNFNFIPVINRQNKIKDILFWDDIFSFNQKRSYKKLSAEIVIMAGGKGKRLSPISDIFPKPLIPLKGKPLINHVVDHFLKFKISHFYVSVNYKSSLIKTYFKDLDCSYNISFIDEKKPLGTIGAIKKIKSKIKKHFILTNCDIIADIDYADFEKSHVEKKNDITLVVTSKEYSLPYGNCLIDENGKLIKIDEKPTFNHFINSGIYMINKNMINLIPSNTKYDVDQFINQAIRKKFKIGIYPIESDQWFDVGSWSEFYKVSNLGN